jgi:Na+/H+ antiporter NhaA
MTGRPFAPVGFDFTLSALFFHFHPLRAFLRTESGSAAVLLAATLTALAWANIHVASYEWVWRTPLSIRLGGFGLSQTLRDWVNSGLMTLFFFVIGLEARREFDLGELRERRRVILPLVAGIGGMVVPVAIYLAANAGRPSAHGWGVAMSTDTAFALGALALAGRRLPDTVRLTLEFPGSVAYQNRPDSQAPGDA